MERNWDIELINAPEVIKERLDSGPQLCQVLSKEIKSETLYNLARDHYLFSTEIAAEDRLIILCGAFKEGVEMQPDPEKTQKAFGRQVTEQVFDDLVHIDEVPYLPFCKDLDRKVIDRMRAVYDIRDIEYNSETRTAILGHYYDAKNVPKRPGRVIAQSKPIYN